MARWCHAGRVGAWALVRPCPEAALVVYPVRKAVGNVRNEGAGLIQPFVYSLCFPLLASRAREYPGPHAGCL